MPSKWVHYEIGGCRPESREGGTLTKITLTGENYAVIERVYLFGGMGRGLLSNLSYFNITANGIY